MDGTLPAPVRPRLHNFLQSKELEFCEFVYESRMRTIRKSISIHGEGHGRSHKRLVALSGLI